MSHANSNLLLIDGNPERLFPLAQWLGKREFRVVTAATPGQATGIAARRRIGLLVIAEGAGIESAVRLIDEIRGFRNQRRLPALVMTPCQSADVLFRVRHGQPEYWVRNPLDGRGLAELVSLLVSQPLEKPATTVDLAHRPWPAGRPSTLA